jgi:hypothetical protein
MCFSFGNHNLFSTVGSFQSRLSPPLFFLAHCVFC